MFALIDCNNFFVSCERVFQPHLKYKPVAVLSRNDGCIIARSNEVKKMGIPMGAPAFKWREVLEKGGVKLFSSNFELYGDLSARVMHILNSFSEKVQIYSVDEAFIQSPELSNEKLIEYGNEIVRHIYQLTGIPVSVGIAPTKTLCKIATEFAKKLENTSCFLMDPKDPFFNEKLKQIRIDDIWGVGRAMAPKMTLLNLFNAYDLKEAYEPIIRKKFGVFGARLIQELKGKKCFTLDEEPHLKKSIRFTRSFSKAIYQKKELKKIVSHFTAMATEKLRRQNAMAHFINVMISTSRHEEDRYQKSINLALNQPSFYTPHLIKKSLEGFEKIFQPNRAYKRVGITLMGITPMQNTQYDLFGERTEQIDEKSEKTMRCIDELNRKFGKGSIRFLAEESSHHAKIKSSCKSAEFSTNWEEVLEIKI